MKKLFNSLRFQIALSILLTGIVAILLLHVIVVNTYQNNLINQRTIDIHQRCTVIANTLGERESIQSALTAETNDVMNWYSEAYGGRFLVVDANYRILLDTYSADVGKNCISDAVFSAFLGKEYQYYNAATGFLEFVLPVTNLGTDGKQITAALICSSDTGWIRTSLRKVEQAMLFVEGILLVIFTVASIYVSYLMTRPVKKVSYELEKVKVGHFDQRLSELRSYNEINEITDAASHIIDSYQRMERSQEEFVSNVSHELRTPMTSIRVLADSLIGQKNIDESVYQEFLSDISVEVDRETHIIDDLLSMSRLGNASESMNISTVKINDFVMDILKTVRPIAEKRNIELVYESFRNVTADIDAVKLSQAFSNLIENGVKYNEDGGYVKVSLDADHEYFYLRVADNGVGIPEDALPHIFNRFYRVDKARSRETGGTGLGLSITKQIILLHHGVIKAESKVNEGTTFTVRIPLKHTSPEGGD